MKTPVKNCTLVSQSVKGQGAHPWKSIVQKFRCSAHLQRPETLVEVQDVEPKCCSTLAEANEGDAQKIAQSTMQPRFFVELGLQRPKRKQVVNRPSRYSRCDPGPQWCSNASVSKLNCSEWPMNQGSKVQGGTRGKHFGIPLRLWREGTNPNKRRNGGTSGQDLRYHTYHIYIYHI